MKRLLRSVFNHGARAAPRGLGAVAGGLDNPRRQVSLAA